MKISAIVYARDDADFLKRSLNSMVNQTLQFSEIIYVDDASIDDSVEIAKEFGVTIIKQTHRHPPLHGDPSFSHIPNLAIKYIHNVDYFLVNGADIILEPSYVEKLSYIMQSQDAVLGSGVIEGQNWREDIPKGAGRLHEIRFWRRYVKEYPFCYGWEAQPIYLAQMHGYKTLCTPEAKMKALRPTVLHKPRFGVAMRQLGYFPPMAVLRCLRGIVKHPRSTVQMLIQYLFTHEKATSKKLRFWLRNQQAHELLRLMRHPKKFLPVR